MVANPLAPDWLLMPADSNELVLAVWPQNAARDDAGQLEIAGVSAGQLTPIFGSPLYVIDEADARARAREIRESFEREMTAVGGAAKVYYAGKAFLCTAVAKWMVEEGLNIDVATGGELAVALAAEVPGERIGLHGNNKSLAELKRAVAAGVGTIVIDSAIEIERLAKVAAEAGVRQRVRLRVKSGVHAHTHDFLATAHEDQKFGVSLEEAPELVAAIRAEASLEFVGLHCHIGSQIFGTAAFAESAARLLTLHAELLAGGDVPELNIGGGFGIAYTAADDPAAPADIAREIAQVVATECSRLGIPVPTIAIEPGRAIIGSAGVTLYTVGTVKPVEVSVGDSAEGKTAIRTYVSVDGGMSDNARPALYGANYSARLANRVSDAEPILVRVAGKHCESGDIVVYDEYLPGDVHPGDVLAVPATGAYCWSLASNYNYMTRPPIVAVIDGIARVIVRGETEEDLLARDMGIERGKQ